LRLSLDGAEKQWGFVEPSPVPYPGADDALLAESAMGKDRIQK
jgi:hypothetical protein